MCEGVQTWLHVSSFQQVFIHFYDAVNVPMYDCKQAL